MVYLLSWPGLPRGYRVILCESDRILTQLSSNREITLEGPRAMDLLDLASRTISVAGKDE